MKVARSKWVHHMLFILLNKMLMNFRCLFRAKFAGGVVVEGTH